MSTEEVVASAVSKFIDWVIILITSYFWLVIHTVKKDVNGVADKVREVERDVEKCNETLMCTKIAVGKLQQQLEDYIKDRR